ncbi:MAG: hypothetical protein KDA58_13900 [Planctomycetaceae bacterium]|nr:hypothetical protein [Planctomycetaceae bacterium]
MLQNTTLINTNLFGNLGNGTSVRANIVARGLQLEKGSRHHRGKPLSESCRPYCCDGSTSRMDESMEPSDVRWLEQESMSEDRLFRPVASPALPPFAWATLVVQHAMTV